MKVLLIGFTKIVYMPYINFYIDQLQKSNCDISLVYWDRDSSSDLELPSEIKTYCFKEDMLDSEPIVKKIPYFIKFRKFTKKIISNNQFDLVVVLHSTPGVLLSDVLVSQYKDRYVVDYRDFTYENLNFYKKGIHRLINNSRMTFVSSKGYLRYLPDSKNMYISHNLLSHSTEDRNIRRKKNRDNAPIRIRFWGFVRHVDINKVIINKMGNDSRFELHYHGREQESGEILRKFVEENNIKNVFFHGEYKPIERIKFASQTDLLHNIYENDVKTTFAMGNKYYDGVVFYIPQLCNKGSFMGKEVEATGVGAMLDPNDDGFTDAVFNYYKMIDWEAFNANCDIKLNKISEEYNSGMSVLHDILVEKEG